MQLDLRILAADDQELFRDIRLRALADAADAFGRTLAEALEVPPDQWRDLTAGPGPRMVVLEDGDPVAMGGVFAPEGEPRAMVWGMWTAPEARGRGLGARVRESLRPGSPLRIEELRLGAAEEL